MVCVCVCVCVCVYFLLRFKNICRLLNRDKLISFFTIA